MGVGGGELEGAVGDDGVVVGDPVVGGEVGGLFDGDTIRTAVEGDEPVIVCEGGGVDRHEHLDGQALQGFTEAGGAG